MGIFRNSNTMEEKVKRRNSHRRKNIKLEINELSKRESILIEELDKVREQVKEKWQEFNDLKDKG